ncbi:MAG: hypothetical protein GTO45_00520 [Candidatus Aminicenantes bacterium]|nr:hypothetical protein [Candidatus Aminicenantes bacterium]NIM77246.1 hypothetical protein [Candidatus Aminicenantes bacterium]NIN16547.1 hypothetical protein [Candidatus Aminicenantes bacterium]NIN40405.1 hypothetical protein [Candidatus Aminicenantes bacterium]NIN83225.1 hypothetical protein [Candidatus Aminicenantes bacterium]
MKQTTLNKKLVINKITISNLTIREQGAIRGGNKDTIQDKSCDCSAPGLTCQDVKAAGTVHGRTCDEVIAAGTVHGRTCDL